MAKQPLCFILVLLLFASISFAGVYELDAEAASNWASWTTTGNPQQDIVNCAVAQNGKKAADLGFENDWCASFVSQCARKVGIPTSVIANHSGAKFIDIIETLGGVEVSAEDVKPGDIVQFITYGAGNPVYNHVGIMTEKGKYVSGNMNGSGAEPWKTSKVVITTVSSTIAYSKKNPPEWIARYFRPNYNNSTSSDFTVMASEASSVTQNNAVVKAHINFGKTKPVEWGIDVTTDTSNWSEKNVPLKNSTAITSWPDTGMNISVNFANDAQSNPLQPNTTYFYRFWVKVSDDVFVHSDDNGAEAKRFKTKAPETTYSLVFDSVGGSSVSTIKTKLGSSFTVPDSTKSGYTLKGWYAKRSDNTWHVNGHGWLTEAEIASKNYTKEVYTVGRVLSFDTGWTGGNTSAAFTFYAVWEDNGSSTPTAAKTVTSSDGLHTYVRYDNVGSGIYWTDAYSYCQDGHLVTITSDAEQNLIKNQLLQGCPNNVYFIGATDAGSDGNWSWVDTGDVFWTGGKNGSVQSGFVAYWDRDYLEPSDNAGEDYAAIMGKNVGKNKQIGDWIDIELVGGEGDYSLENCGFICEYDYVAFDANGGSGAPDKQTKAPNTALTLTSTKPTRANASAGNYTVTLDANGGSVDKTSLTAARTTSYTFKNWNTVADGSGTSYNAGASYTANAAATLYAQWNSSSTTAAVTLPTPTRDGYTFEGWATSSSATSGVKGSYTPNGNVTLHAIWQAVYYLDLNGRLDGTRVPNIAGYGTADIYVNGDLAGKGKTDFFIAYPAGTQYEIKNIQATEGHKYNGVDGDVPLSGTITDSKVNIILSFSTIYDVNYDVNGGSGTIPSQTKAHGTALTLTSTKPTRADVSGGSYTVTLNANGGSVSPSSLTAARTNSYTFKNWNTVADGSGTSYNAGASYTANAAATLYAQWTSSTTTAAVTLPTPTRDGYTFKGWGTSSSATSGVTGSYTPNENVTLYAVWTPNVLTIQYHSNSGTIGTNEYSFSLDSEGYILRSGNRSVSTWKYGTTHEGGLINQKTFALSRPGYVFQGWHLGGADASAVYDQDAALTPEQICPELKNQNKTVTFYALWQANELTLKYHANGGTVSSSAFVVSSDGIIQKDGSDYTQIWKYGYAPKNGLSNDTAFGLSRPGYTFSGWSAVQDGSGTVFDQNDATVTGEKINPALVDGNVAATVYAIWEPVRYTSVLTLPAAMSSIEEEAFQGTAAEAVIVPDSVSFIADNAFDSNIVIIAERGSEAESYASRNGLTFIDVEDYNG